MSLALSDLLNPAPSSDPSSPQRASEPLAQDASNQAPKISARPTTNLSSMEPPPDPITSGSAESDRANALRPSLFVMSEAQKEPAQGYIGNALDGQPHITQQPAHRSTYDADAAVLSLPAIPHIETAIPSYDGTVEIASLGNSMRATPELENEASGLAMLKSEESTESQTTIKTEIDMATGDIPTPSVVRKQSGSTKKSTEGLDSDKRYLCYICNKLFTRRRSVKDHINKIHHGHKFEADKSLEIIVDPATGIPVDPNAIPPLPEGEASSPSPENPATVKTEASLAGSPAPSVEPFTTPAPVIGKKRPAPASSTSSKPAPKNTGTGKIKYTATPVNKKIKTSDVDSVSGTPVFRSPSGTPASSRVGKPPSTKFKKQSSMSVASSPVPSESRMSVDAGDDDGDAYTPNTNGENSGEIFCICRRGDDHKWMIACDGQCEDWFHGKCVGIEERDGDLIDKYICPNCTRDGFQTTWKRMCRRKACRNPALVTVNPPSKYCSKECGRMFFVEMVQRSDADAPASPSGQHVVDPVTQKKYRKKRRKQELQPSTNDNLDDEDAMDDESTLSSPDPHHSAYQHLHDPSDSEATHSSYETSSSAPNSPLPSRGGPVRASEIKSLVTQYPDIPSWRSIGSKPTTPPPSSPGNRSEGQKLSYTSEESSQLSTLASKIETHNSAIAILNAREQLLALTKVRAASMLENLRNEGNPKLKDICGFDSRLSWSDKEFSTWQTSEEGNAAFSSGILPAPSPATTNEHNAEEMRDPDYIDDSDGSNYDEPASQRDGMCIRPRCVRHGKWQKLATAEIRFEIDRLQRGVERMAREEGRLRQRAVVRAWEESGDR